MNISFYGFIYEEVTDISLKTETILLKLSNRADMINRCF